VLIAEPAAGLLSDDACREFSSVYVRRIVEQVQDDNFAVILHNCGNTGQCTAAMVATGSMGYHFGNGMDMAAALRDCPSDTLVMGNVDPVSVFKMGTPEQVYGASTALLGCTPPPRDNIVRSSLPSVKVRNRPIEGRMIIVERDGTHLHDGLHRPFSDAAEPRRFEEHAVRIEIGPDTLHRCRHLAPQRAADAPGTQVHDLQSAVAEIEPVYGLASRLVLHGGVAQHRHVARCTHDHRRT